ncbi:MAG: 16S rRNA (cytosine(1402)-N(4))-methyltransferase, partial [Alphaproteobacteria bacterium]|nr:16S rRNA (cytosine(1402)-N(4))-methyltransferase [Alphaproteobacteria bacterium]
NQEFAAIESGLKAAERLLAPGGRLVVVSFHSLEDRIVKRFIHSRCGKLGEPSRHLPEKSGDVVAPHFFMPRPEKKTASEAETSANPRSRSATIRMMERAA